MEKTKKYNKGLGDPLTMMLMAVLFMALVLVVYFTLVKGRDSLRQTETGEGAVPTISESDDIDVMRKELDAIDAGSFEEDLEDMESDASDL